ncbi:hypothetical protein GCM10010297_61110 [Streptomyces malachitofuscus]|nr:hypothetical protein GCM10010297_61110 [Streptomyces malachitofuscus]
MESPQVIGSPRGTQLMHSELEDYPTGMTEAFEYSWGSSDPSDPGKGTGPAPEQVRGP